MSAGIARVGDEPRHYTRLGLTDSVEAWEDGLRADPQTSGTYEWWYFDAHLANGAKLVVVFHAKPFTDTKPGLAPAIEIDLDTPDGRHFEFRESYPAAEFGASTERCDVRIGRNTFSGDLHEYRITASAGGLEVDIALVGETEPWRPRTGHIFYGADESKYFAWLPAVPFGRVAASYTFEGQTVETTGEGYHDHNWGNVSLPQVVDHWYWGRGKVGPYTFITAHIIPTAAYVSPAVDVYMLAEDGWVVADDYGRVAFSADDVSTDAETGKPVAALVRYDYGDGEARIDYRVVETIYRAELIDGVHGVKRLLARLIGFDGAYLRFRGEVAIERAGKRYADQALWELMYFGRAPKA